MHVLCCCTCPNTGVIVTICFSFVCLVTLVLTCLLLTESHFYHLSNSPQNPHLVTDLKFFHHSTKTLFRTFQLIIYNDGIILLRPPWLHQEKALGFIFVCLFFFFTSYPIFFLLSGTSKEKLYIFMTRRVF